MILKKIFLIFCITISFQACDFLSTKDSKVVGNVYAVNPQTQSDDGFSLVYIDGTGVNDNILKEYILSVIGDDSILLVHCYSEDNANLYYKINHNKGVKPINAVKIDKSRFDSLAAIIIVKYNFSP